MSLLSSTQREALSEEFNEFLEQMRIIGWKEMRSWSEFGSNFKIPDSKSLEPRITANFLHFRTNYIIITASIFVLRILLAPLLFLSIVCCAMASAAFVFLHKEPLKIGDFELNQKTKITVCAVGSILFLALCGAVEHLLWGLIYSVLICVGHMVFRPRSISSKSNKVYEEIKIGTSGWFGKSHAKSKSDENLQSSVQDPENPSGNDSVYNGGSVRKRTSPQGLYQ